MNFNPFKNGIPVFPVLLLLLLLTWATILYSKGYRVDLEQQEMTLTQTGMLSVRSVPEGAKVYLDGKPVTATNSTISSLKPGEYTIEVRKEGFEPWRKRVKVYNDLVTDITALLVSQSPRIEPLTSSGVSAFSLSHDGTRIAYTTKNGEDPGVWILPLTGSANINIFGGNRNILVKDSPSIAYSLAQEIYWSPDDRNILIQMTEEKFYVLDVSNGADTPPEATSSASLTFDYWNKVKKEKLTKYVEKLNIDDSLVDAALDPNAVWSPDFKKILVKNELEDGGMEYAVYNFEDPLPVGEKRKYVPLKYGGDEEEVAISWYSDSFHLIVVEGQTVYLIRIDGENKSEIFTGNLAKKKAFSTPGGDKVIILASFKNNVAPDLYTVSIR